MSDRTRGDSSNNSLRILASLVIALCIWLFSAFNDDCDHAIHAKLSYAFPPDVEVDGSLPDQVILQLRGNGWTLLRASAYHPQVKVDWQEIKDRTVIDLQKYKGLLSAEIPGNAEVVDIYPGFVPVKYTEIDSVKLPVQPNVRWRSDKHSTDSIKLKPDSVWVKGEGRGQCFGRACLLADGKTVLVRIGYFRNYTACRIERIEIICGGCSIQFQGSSKRA
jgi:hypothetical protein